jgi:hypothetical protein
MPVESVTGRESTELSMFVSFNIDPGISYKYVIRLEMQRQWTDMPHI